MGHFTDTSRKYALAARLSQHQLRHGAQRADIAHRLVRMTWSARQQSGERADVDHLRAFAALVVDLLVRPGGQEAGERVHDWQRATASHARRHGRHVLLGDAALHEPFREPLREGDQAAVLYEVGVERDEMRMPFRLFDERPFVGGDQVVGLAWLTTRIPYPRFGRDGAQTELTEERVRGSKQLRNPGGVTLFVRRARVEAVQLSGFRRRPFHEADAFPLHRVGNDDLWLVGDAVQRAERALQRGNVVAVAADDVPPERAELGFDVTEITDGRHPGVRLNLVVIDDRHDLSETKVRGRSERLPELSFLELAVAGQHEDASWRTLQAIGQRHSLGFGDSHAKRARVCLDEWRLDVRVSRQSVQATQLVKHVGGQQPQADEHVVERRRVVPLGGEEHVTRLGPLIEIAQLVEKQPAHDLERAEAGADVPGPGAGNHVERVDARKRGKRAGALTRVDVSAEQPLKLPEGDVLKV